MTAPTTTSRLVRRRATAPAPRRRSAERRRRRVALVMLSPAIAGLLIFFVYPLLASVYFSFTRYNQLSSPQWVGLLNYRYLFTQDPQVGAAALNTLWFVVILVPIRIVCALLVAGLLVRARTAAGLWRTIFYLPALVPPVASVVAFVFLFNPGTGPVNLILKFFGIHGPLWFNSPSWSKPSLVILGVWVMGDIMIIFLASLLDVPKELYEATSLDGANGVQQVRHITLPMIAPVIGFAIVTGVIAALQYFTEAAVASGVASGQATVGGGSSANLGYPGTSLLTYTELLYQHGFANFQFGYASAMAVVLFVITAVLLALTIRRISVFRPEVDN
ncbi:sugar ABC transporter permease [Frondihabitans sp. PAMC 28766]|uniref:carbohydrate ABC transporter permease n=1 Tax=Frondihabitans sp. PAMC 28766 TaxID=1795630 RepID=UPI00078EA108|nr:sugar ABC transporter permease [Frondihabitans sp. PAMC 28766]AMM19883.1 sugar ABC transporter permease [Frondihabitans sp. PAMC 28766]